MNWKVFGRKRSLEHLHVAVLLTLGDACCFHLQVRNDSGGRGSIYHRNVGNIAQHYTMYTPKGRINMNVETLIKPKISNQILLSQRQMLIFLRRIQVRVVSMSFWDTSGPSVLKQHHHVRLFPGWRV
jgi:hypothetical protein